MNWLRLLGSLTVSLCLSFSIGARAQQRSAGLSPWRDGHPVVVARTATAQLRSYRPLTLDVAALRGVLLNK